MLYVIKIKNSPFKLFPHFFSTHHNRNNVLTKSSIKAFFFKCICKYYIITLTRNIHLSNLYLQLERHIYLSRSLPITCSYNYLS